MSDHELAELELKTVESVGMAHSDAWTPVDIAVKASAAVVIVNFMLNELEKEETSAGSGRWEIEEWHWRLQ